MTFLGFPEQLETRIILPIWVLLFEQFFDGTELKNGFEKSKHFVTYVILPSVNIFEITQIVQNFIMTICFR